MRAYEPIKFLMHICVMRYVKACAVALRVPIWRLGYFPLPSVAMTLNHFLLLFYSSMDLSKKQIFELEELLERQNKILANKNFLSKLPDRGEKIRSFRDKLLKELQHKNEVDKAANLLSRLNIVCEGKAALTQMEWTGRYNKNEDTSEVIELDSDDEEDPLKILAQPTGAGVHRKKIIRVIPEESLIKPEDLQEIQSFKTDPLDIQHVRYIVDKVEKDQKDTNKKKEPFKPYKTTRSNVHDPAKEKQRKLPKNWEITAATPPLIVHEAAKVLSLDESFRLQQEQTEKRKAIQARCTIERLADRAGTHSVDSAPTNVGSYRTKRHGNDSLSSSSSSEDEEAEVYDEEDDDNGGTVVFTVDSIES